MTNKVRNLCFIFVLLPFLMRAQQGNLTPEKQRLWLQLSSGFYLVAQDAQIDLDSSLVLVSRKSRLSRWTVITEGFGDGFTPANNTWVDAREPGVAVKRLPTLHGIDHAKLSLLIGAYYAFQPGYHQKDRDSAQYYLSRAKQESESLDAAFWVNQSICLLGKNYFKGNQVKEGTICFKNLISNCQKLGDILMEAKSWDYQGFNFPLSATSAMIKLSSIKKANDLYEQLGLPEKQVNALMTMGYLAFLLGDINGAEANGLRTLHLENAINFPYIQYACDFLSLTYWSKGQADKGLSYALRAVNVSLATKDSLGLAYFYGRVGMAEDYRQTNKQSSIIWFKKSVEEFSKNNDPFIYRVLLSLCNNLIETGKDTEAISLLQRTLKNISPARVIDRQYAFFSLALAYQQLKNNGLAEKYLLLANQLETGDTLATRDFRASEIDLRLAEFYYDTKRYDKAKPYLQAYLNLSGSELRDKPAKLSQAHLLLYKIDSLQGNYPSSLEHLRQYIEFYRIVADSNQAKNIAGMRIQYQVEQKEKDMQILEAKSALQTQHASDFRKFTLIGLAVALLIIAMLYNRYYINKKQKQQIDKKNIELQNLITEKNELLSSKEWLLKEKEWLLKEVHHRVKNNLHTVICLLEAQARYLENDALKAIANSQHRIYAMSLIHQKLYQSDDIKTIDMSVYIFELVQSLEESFGTSDQIKFKLSIDPINLTLSHAIPLGLIVNEAVTNSIKYAFPDNRKGEISISMAGDDDRIKLELADNGIGMPEIDREMEPKSLGLRLMKGLSEDIEANISFNVDNGTRITIIFKPDALNDPDGFIKSPKTKEMYI